MINPAAPALLSAGDSVLFIDHKKREYLRTLEEGQRIHLSAGTMAASDIIGQPEGLRLRNTANEKFIIIRPTYSQLIPNLPRAAQVIYPKDIGPILMGADIYPGASVIEVGTGPGSLSMALLRAIGPTGRLVSYEIRQDHIDMARGNVERFLGPRDNWTVKLRDAAEGFDERDIDRMTIDMPEPWRLVDVVAEALRPGAVVLGYVPTVLQIKQFVDKLESHPCFGMIEVSETLQRFWHVEGLSVRPEHRMVAHTGFLITARRLLPA